MKSLRYLYVLASSFGSLAAAFAQPPTAANPTSLVDPETGVVHSTRLLSGVPLGGIGAGCVQLMTDGAISRATYNNNWNQPTGDLPGCFAAVWMRLADRSVARTLSLHNGYGLPAVIAIDYLGLYPTADVRYPDPALPIELSLRAFSPLVPGDVKSSSFPAAAFVFRLHNPTKLPIDVSVALSWENTLGVGGTATRGPFHDRTGDLVSRMVSIGGYFGMRFTGPATATATGEDRLRANASGEYRLMAHAEREQAVVTTAGWDALTKRPAWWDRFSRDGSVEGDAPVGAEGRAHPAGVVAVRIAVRPGDTVEIPYIFSWYTPHHFTLNGVDHGHFYQIAFADADDAGRQLLGNWRSLLALTEEWQQRIASSNLPRWLSRRLVNSAAPLSLNTIHTLDDRFFLLADAGANENADAIRQRDDAQLLPITRRLAVCGLLLALFPRLDAIELAQFAAGQSPTGAVPRTLGDIDRGFGVPPPAPGSPASPIPFGVFNGLPADPADAAAFAIQVAQYVLGTGDISYLAELYPNVRLALRAVLDNGLDGEGLPLPTRSIQVTSDTRSTPPLTPSAATLWLAALRSAERLAAIAGDQAFERELKRAGDRSSAAVMKRFFDGKAFVTQPDRLRTDDGLIGAWVSASLGLGPILPENAVAAAVVDLESGSSHFGPPLRTRADGTIPPNDREGTECFAPAATLADATLSILYGRPDQALELLRKLDTTRNETLRTPWAPPLRFRADSGSNVTPGLATAAAAADWNVLNAVDGFQWHPDTQTLTVAPSIPGTWRTLAAPLFAPTFWGYLKFKPTAHGGIVTVRVDRVIALTAATLSRVLSGTPALVVKAVRVPGPPAGASTALPSVHVTVSRAPIGAQSAIEPSGSILITFDAPITLNAGDRLEIEMH